MSSQTLPYSMKDVQYNNAKFRRRSLFQAYPHTSFTKRVKRECMSFSTGKFLALLMICGLTYLVLTRSRLNYYVVNDVSRGVGSYKGDGSILNDGVEVKRPLIEPRRLPPQLWPDELGSNNKSIAKPNVESEWTVARESVKKAFIHEWNGYKNYAMGYDELMALSKRGVEGLGRLGANAVNFLGRLKVTVTFD